MRRLPKAMKRVSKEEFVKKMVAYQDESPLTTSPRSVIQWQELGKENTNKFVIRW